VYSSWRDLTTCTKRGLARDKSPYHQRRIAENSGELGSVCCFVLPLTRQRAQVAEADLQEPTIVESLTVFDNLELTLKADKHARTSLLNGLSDARPQRPPWRSNIASRWP
jgi:hypothetical protein